MNIIVTKYGDNYYPNDKTSQFLLEHICNERSSFHKSELKRFELLCVAHNWEFTIY